MKKIVLLMLSFCILLLLSGCCLSHSWTDATCTTPKTCSKCEKVEGEPLGHQWKEATCSKPKTCTGCGITEGEKLEHEFGKEEIHNPDYVKATGLYVKTCIHCGTQGKRRAELERLTEGRTFLPTLEEFSKRFTNMLLDMEYIGKGQYVSYLSDESTSDTAKMYMAKKDSRGNLKTVAEFEVFAPDFEPLPAHQQKDSKAFWKIQGTVKGKDPALLAMLALWRAGDPTNTMEKYWNHLDKLKAIEKLFGNNGKIDIYSVPDSKSIILQVSPKGSSTYEFTLRVENRGY